MEKEQMEFLKEAGKMETDRLSRDAEIIQEEAQALTDREKSDYRYDPKRFEDKFLALSFARNALSELFPGETHINLKRDQRKALAEELRAEDTPFREEITDEDQTLKNVLHDAIEYSRFHETATDNYSYRLTPSGMEAREQYESRLGTRIYRRLTLLYNRILERQEEQNRTGERIELTEEEAKAEDQKLYVIANLLNHFDQQFNGRLGMDPSSPMDDTALYMVQESKYFGNKLSQEENTLNAKYDDDMPMEAWKGNMPLFSHTPSAWDVVQGRIGNCYFVSVLSAIADKHPERIRDMMRDNGNGTVTVRLHQEKNGKMEPFYVAVDKVVSHAQSKGTLWVRTFEKALAVSGLIVSQKFGKNAPLRPVPSNINEIYRSIPDKREFARNPQNKIDYPWLFANKDGVLSEWSPDLEHITSGRESTAFKVLLGEETVTKEVELDDVFGEHPHKEEDVLPISLDEAYTQDELNVFEAMKKGLNKHSILCAATHPHEKGDSKKILGLNLKHAYTVLGIETVDIDGHPRNFIKLRNPHGEHGRTYVKDPKNNQIIAVANNDLKKHANPNYNGTCYVELKHFCKEFQSYTIAEVKENSIERENRISREERDTLRSFRRALKKTDELLAESSGRFNSNSQQYRNIRTFLQQMDLSFPATYEQLGTQFRQLETLIQDYRTYTQQNKVNDERRNGKLKACSILEEIISSARHGYRKPELSLMEAAVNKSIENLKIYQPKNDDEKLQKKFAEGVIARNPSHAKTQILRYSVLHGKNGAARNIIQLYDLAQKGLKPSEISDAITAAMIPKRTQMVKLKDLRENLTDAERQKLEESRRNLNQPKEEKAGKQKEEIAAPVREEVKFF